MAQVEPRRVGKRLGYGSWRPLSDAPRFWFFLWKPRGRARLIGRDEDTPTSNLGIVARGAWSDKSD